MGQTIIESLTSLFKTQFNQEHSHILFSPGRLNFIGHHSDFTQGQIISTTLKQGTFAIYALREDDRINCYCPKSGDQTIHSFSIHDLTPTNQPDWIEKLKIIIQKINKSAPFITQGFDILVNWTIPSEAGVAANASLNSLLTTTVTYLYDLDLTEKMMAEIALETDREFNHFKESRYSSYSDDVTILNAHRNYFLYYNEKNDSSEHLPFDLGDYQILLIDSLRNRYFNNVKFDERKKQCAKALKIFQSQLSINHLSDLTLSDFERFKHLLADPILEKRVRHIVYEQDRVIRGREALLKNDLAFFAQLINRSYKSMRDFFELTSFELNTIVDAALAQDGVLYANTTDSRLGGTVFALVHHDAIEDVQTKIKEIVHDEIDIEASFQIIGLEDRSRIISSN